VVVGVFATLILWASGVQAAEFVPLGHLDGSTNSDARDVSDDGAVVVGASDRGYRWTAESGMVALEDLPSGRRPRGANSVSVDGSVVVGDAQIDRGRFESYRWTLTGGMEGLGTLIENEALGVSADGSVVVGRGSDQSINEAYRWTEVDGRVGLGGCCDCCSNANGVSADGSVVVGRGNIGSGAFRWTSEEGMVHLGEPGNEALGVSADGSVVVGSGSVQSGNEAFRWTEAGGMVLLGDLPGGEFESSAGAVSADGSVVVGNGTTDSGNEGFIWTQANGMERLQDVLETNGTTGMDGWTLLRVGGISDNGQWIAGWGTNPSGLQEAFLARLPNGTNQVFQINAGLNDAWYNPVTDGQGFFITVFPDLEVVVLAWFTYDTELPPEDAPSNLGDAGHRWLLAVGAFADNVAMLDIEIASGGLFDMSTEIERVTDGSIILSFEDCTKGIVEYDIPSIDQQGVVPIQRVAADNIVLCEALSSE
jgi:probable HAF family extracellular repeat protein